MSMVQDWAEALRQVLVRSRSLGNLCQVWSYGDVDDPEKPLTLAHVKATRTDQEGPGKFEVELVKLDWMDASGGAGVLRRVFEALGRRMAHTPLIYALSEGPK